MRDEARLRNRLAITYRKCTVACGSTAIVFLHKIFAFNAQCRFCNAAINFTPRLQCVRNLRESGSGFIFGAANQNVGQSSLDLLKRQVRVRR